MNDISNFGSGYHYTKQIVDKRALNLEIWPLALFELILEFELENRKMENKGKSFRGEKTFKCIYSSHKLRMPQINEDYILFCRYVSSTKPFENYPHLSFLL